MSQIISDNPILIIFLTAIALLVVWLSYLHLQLWQTKKRIKVFFSGQKASDLEGVLAEQIKRLRQTEKEIKSLEKFNGYLEKMALKSVQKVGLVRFNPFKETGGDQSFSIALLDSQDNGLVISSLYTREGTRIYAKPIVAGESKHNLSKEEEMAIEQAKGSQ